MGIDWHLYCKKCNKNVYTYRKGKVILSDELEIFFSEHVYDCDGHLSFVQDQDTYDLEDVPNYYKNHSYWGLLGELEGKEYQIKHLKSLQIPKKEIIYTLDDPSLKNQISNLECIIEGLRRELENKNAP